MQNGQRINVYSMFRSINGEICQAGQGSWATFIRFAGCNLNCTWCDTQYALNRSSGEMWSIDKIMESILELRCRNITITGGEPLVQRDGLRSLIERLLIQNYNVSIETNGSLSIFDRTSIRATEFLSWVVDFKLPGSGQHHQMSKTKPWHQLSHSDYIKFVILDRRDYAIAISTVQQMWSEGVKAQMVFSPVLTYLPFDTLKGWMLESKLFSVPISVQLHKLVAIHEPK